MPSSLDCCVLHLIAAGLLSCQMRSESEHSCLEDSMLNRTWKLDSAASYRPCAFQCAKVIAVQKTGLAVIVSQLCVTTC